MNEVGKQITFNLQDFLKVAEQLVDADEVERALWVLDNLPAYYRDNIPHEVVALKKSILSRMITPHGYLNDAHDCELVDYARARAIIEGTLRGALIEKELEDGFYHVVDVGPGEYWLPIGVKGQFTYKSVGLDQKTREASLKHPEIVSKYSSRQSKHSIGVFVALEVIEHLPDPRDLAVECAKHFVNEPDYIHLSTPLYTYDSSPKAQAKYLPHLRAYTPREFIMEAQRLWPHYEWQLYMSNIMSLRGVHPNAKRREQFTF